MSHTSGLKILAGGSRLSANNSSKPTPLRSGKRAALKSVPPFFSTTQRGLTQVLGRGDRS
jgi:hypothetical protein